MFTSHVSTHTLCTHHPPLGDRTSADANGHALMFRFQGGVHVFEMKRGRSAQGESVANNSVGVYSHQNMFLSLDSVHHSALFITP